MRQVKIVFISILAILVLPVLYFFMIIAAGMYYNCLQRHRLDQAIDNNLQEIVCSCIAFQKNSARERPYPLSCNSPVLPEIIRGIKCNIFSVDQDLIAIEMHGGFDHFGLRIWKTSNAFDQWEVMQYWEDGEKLLITVADEECTSY